MEEGLDNGKIQSGIQTNTSKHLKSFIKCALFVEVELLNAQLEFYNQLIDSYVVFISFNNFVDVGKSSQEQM